MEITGPLTVTPMSCLKRASSFLLADLIAGPVTLSSCDGNMRGEIIEVALTSHVFPHIKDTSLHLNAWEIKYSVFISLWL